MKKEQLNVTFRYCKKFEEVEMFYYDERKDLVCVTMSEGHTTACYAYYTDDTRPIKENNGKYTATLKGKEIDCTQEVQKLINWYSDVELKIVQRLKRP